MQLFSDRSFDRFRDRDSASIFSDLEFRKCLFNDCAISLTTEPKLRTTVRNVRLIGCSEVGCSLDCAIVEDVLVDGFDTKGQLLQMWGAVFNRVVLRGKIDRLMITTDLLPSVLIAKEHREASILPMRFANAAYYREVEWALDISGGEFGELEIRGIPTELIRRDPETQVVITRDNALKGTWRELPFKETLMSTSIKLFLEFEEHQPSKILLAPKRHPKFRHYLHDIELLRKAGIAEPD